MQLFKVSIKFEQKGKWSERETDLEGYLVKSSETEDTVQGYVSLAYPNLYGHLRYVKGLYTPYGSLIFMQMSNAFSITPVCYCFPNPGEQGYWCEYTNEFGFFPILSGHACSLGHATLQMEELTAQEEILQETLAFFKTNASDATSVNCDLMKDTPYLTDFLKPDIVSQIELHCGKW